MHNEHKEKSHGEEKTSSPESLGRILGKEREGESGGGI